MPNFGYTNPLPVATNNPSFDQPNMTINNNSVAGILAVDHFGFENNNGGWHQKVTLINGLSAPGTAANQSILFNFFNGNGLALQLAGQLPGNGFASLYNFNNAPGITLPKAAANGYTCLAGPGQTSIILQWGIIITSAPETGTVNFVSSGNIKFPNGIFGVWTQPKSSGVPNGNGTITVSNVSQTAFAWQYYTQSTSIINFYWVALGY